MLLASIGGHKSATAMPRVEEREVSQSGQTEMGKRSFTVRQLFRLSILNFMLLTYDGRE